MTSDRRLHLTKDRKVSPRGVHQPGFRDGRGRWNPTIPNSFGLPAGASCPGKTPFCHSCYAARSENGQSVHEAVRHNLDLLLAAGTDDKMAELLVEMLDRFVAIADRWEIAPKDRIFRIHWDGDFFSIDYASAWAHAIRQFPDIKFFVYTRSFVEPVNVIPVLVGLENLSIYLSTDEWNLEWARATVEVFPEVRLAFCTADYAGGRDLARKRKAIVCPENAEKMPLTSDKGRGACVDCQLCVKGRADVLFSTSHQEEAAQIVRLGDEIPIGALS